MLPKPSLAATATSNRRGSCQDLGKKGQLLTGTNLKQYRVSRGLCGDCGETQTHRLETSKYLRQRKYVPQTLKLPSGEYTVYKGYCLRCWSWPDVQRALGETTASSTTKQQLTPLQDALAGLATVGDDKRHWWLDRCGLTNKDVQDLSSGLSQVPSIVLTTVSLAHNPQITNLQPLAQRFDQLVELRLDGNPQIEWHALLMRLQYDETVRLQTLSLQNCQLSNAFLQRLVTALSENLSLRNLVLSNNPQLSALAGLVSSKTKLHHLALAGCPNLAQDLLEATKSSVGALQRLDLNEANRLAPSQVQLLQMQLMTHKVQCEYLQNHPAGRTTRPNLEAPQQTTPATHKPCRPRPTHSHQIMASQAARNQLNPPPPIAAATLPPIDGRTTRTTVLEEKNRASRRTSMPLTQTAVSAPRRASVPTQTYPRTAVLPSPALTEARHRKGVPSLPEQPKTQSISSAAACRSSVPAFTKPVSTPALQNARKALQPADPKTLASKLAPAPIPSKPARNAFPVPQTGTSAPHNKSTPGPATRKALPALQTRTGRPNSQPNPARTNSRPDRTPPRTSDAPHRQCPPPPPPPDYGTPYRACPHWTPNHRPTTTAPPDRTPPRTSDASRRQSPPPPPPPPDCGARPEWTPNQRPTTLAPEMARIEYDIRGRDLAIQTPQNYLPKDNADKGWSREMIEEQERLLARYNL